MDRVVTPEERDEREWPHRARWGDQLREIGETLMEFGDAMKGDEQILGPLIGECLANQLSALPKHIRDVLMEHLSDEAAHGYETDRRYMETHA